ncbi:MAG: hypothetical protein PHT69_02060 [Bacteroidales bacterium]|nr:hypothetical protein [Bacteroidales bacterium]
MEYILQNYSHSQLNSNFYSIQYVKNKELLVLNHKNKGAIMFIDKHIFNRYKDVLNKVSGNVLCLGLGLGLAYHVAKTNKNIKSINFVEIDNELINFLNPITNTWETNIYNGNALTYHPTKNYDYIFCDIAIKKEKKNKEIAKQIKNQYKNSKVIFLEGMYN